MCKFKFRKKYGEGSTVNPLFLSSQTCIKRGSKQTTISCVCVCVCMCVCLSRPQHARKHKLVSYTVPLQQLSKLCVQKKKLSREYLVQRRIKQLEMLWCHIRINLGDYKERLLLFNDSELYKFRVEWGRNKMQSE
jgi:hypothetical protein